MKRSALILTIFSIGIFGGLALAEDQDMEGMDMQQPGGQQQDGGMMGGGMGMMEGKGMKGKGMMGMMGGKGMMHDQPKIVATSDGGVVVLQGPKLAKYDAGLNLVNEVELKGGPKPGEKKSAHDHSDGPTPMTEEDVAAALGQAPEGDPQAQ